MKLGEWLARDGGVAQSPTPRGVEDALVLSELAGSRTSRRRWRLAALVLVLVVLALLQPTLSRSVARFAPPIAATGEFLMQATGTWQGYSIFTVDRSAVVVAAIADGAWPTPARVWPEVRALRIAPDLYAFGPDHTGAVMYYAMPGAAGHTAWLASPGPDGRWASRKEEPREVAAAIDQLARQFEADSLARLARGEPGGPWSYNVRWGDDHIVLFQLMLLARGRHAAVRPLLTAGAPALHEIERLNLPSLWADQAADAAVLLRAMQGASATQPPSRPTAA